MPFSVFPKFRASAAVLSDKIDAVARELAALLNGGLGAANVKAGAAFPLASFVEQRGVYVMRAAHDYLTDVGTERHIGKIPIAGRIVGWGCWLYKASTLGANEIPFLLNGVQVGTLALAAPSTTERAGHATLDEPIAVAAGDVLKATFPYSTDGGEVCVLIEADHQG